MFFPTFTAGPIFRYRDFQKVYNKPVPLTTDRFITCVKRFIKGMFKKMVVLYFVSTFFNFLVASEKHWYVSLAIVVFKTKTQAVINTADNVHPSKTVPHFHNVHYKKAHSG